MALDVHDHQKTILQDRLLQPLFLLIIALKVVNNDFILSTIAVFYRIATLSDASDDGPVDWIVPCSAVGFGVQVFNGEDMSVGRMFIKNM